MCWSAVLGDARWRERETRPKEIQRTRGATQGDGGNLGYTITKQLPVGDRLIVGAKAITNITDRHLILRRPGGWPVATQVYRWAKAPQQGRTRVSRAGRKLRAGAMDRQGEDPPGTAPRGCRLRPWPKARAPDSYPKIRIPTVQKGQDTNTPRGVVHEGSKMRLTAAPANA